MIRKRLACLLFAGLFMTAATSGAGEQFLRAAPTQRMASQSPNVLKFLGEGTFRYLGFKLYTARFYLDPKVYEPRLVLADVPKRLVIRYLRDIPKRALIDAAEKNIRNRLPSASLALKESIGRLHERYADIKKGDICELSYSESRTSFYHNGILRAEIDGADFASAYFGIWLSENPISLKLRNDLLGKHK